LDVIEWNIKCWQREQADKASAQRRASLFLMPAAA
jgi:hypothetical protein